MEQKTKQQMNEIKIHGIVKIIIALFIAGMAIGILTGYFMKSSLYSPLITIYKDILSRLTSLDICRSEIFFLSLKRNLKYLVLIYMFAITNIWNWYYGAFLLYIGFSNGLLLTFNIILYGMAGSIRYLCYLFPHSLIFIPIYILIIAHCNSFHKTYYVCTDTAKKGKLLFRQFPFCIFIILFMIAGCILEAWLNLPLVIWY